jgi:hypothetical protein
VTSKHTPVRFRPLRSLHVDEDGERLQAHRRDHPVGPATVVEEARVAQRAGDRRFATFVQLLEDERGGELIRFAYSSGGPARRGPVTLRGRDLERLVGALEACPRLSRALGLGVS